MPGRARGGVRPAGGGWAAGHRAKLCPEGVRLSLGSGPPRAGRHRKMAAASARLRPAKWRECRVPGWSGAGRARGACARRWAGPHCVAWAAAPGSPLQSREGSAVPAPSESPELGPEWRSPQCALARFRSSPARPPPARKESARVGTRPTCRAPGRGPALPPAPRPVPSHPALTGALHCGPSTCPSPPRWSGWGLGPCSRRGTPDVCPAGDGGRRLPYTSLRPSAWLKLRGPTARAALKSAAEPGPALGEPPVWGRSWAMQSRGKRWGGGREGVPAFPQQACVLSARGCGDRTGSGTGTGGEAPGGSQ